MDQMWSKPDIKVLEKFRTCCSDFFFITTKLKPHSEFSVHCIKSSFLGSNKFPNQSKLCMKKALQSEKVFFLHPHT